MSRELVLSHWKQGKTDEATKELENITKWRPRDKITDYWLTLRKHLDLIVTIKGINASFAYNFRLIHLCSAYDDTEVLEKLIDLGADLNVRDEMGRTPLLLAVVTGKYDNAFALIHHEADVNIGGYDAATPLTLATSIEPVSYDLVKALLISGAIVQKHAKKNVINTALKELTSEIDMKLFFKKELSCKDYQTLNFIFLNEKNYYIASKFAKVLKSPIYKKIRSVDPEIFDKTISELTSNDLEDLLYIDQHRDSLFVTAYYEDELKCNPNFIITRAIEDTWLRGNSTHSARYCMRNAESLIAIQDLGLYSIFASYIFEHCHEVICSNILDIFKKNLIKAFSYLDLEKLYFEQDIEGAISKKLSQDSPYGSKFSYVDIIDVEIVLKALANVNHILIEEGHVFVPQDSKKYLKPNWIFDKLSSPELLDEFLQYCIDPKYYTEFISNFRLILTYPNLDTLEHSYKFSGDEADLKITADLFIDFSLHL